ncbi:MAG: putative dsRNA-binding protein [Candidatus Heimdallarchaeota archaeon]|nr:putative dsRNA-binding protein [Candidatus Heimdallarchaeota archaeon]MDH5646460.1 putative dsRNA-binding protein [Candidatus Heimdallarchaeota archaeon]
MDFQSNFIEKFGEERWNQLKTLTKEIETNIGHDFNNRELLYQALSIPATGLNSHEFERLEFLGDAILDLVIGNELYDKFSEFQPRDLTSFRSELAKNEYIGKLSPKLKLSEIGPITNVGILTEAQNSNLFEATIAAIFLDQGRKLDNITKIISNIFDISQVVKDIQVSPWSNRDPKSVLMEYGQKNQWKVEFDPQNVAGQPPEFKVSITITDKNGNIIDTYTAKETAGNKKAAEKITSMELLLKWKEEGKIE